MALIKLTKGKFTIVDDELFEDLNRFKWYAQGREFRPARRITLPRNTIIFMYHQRLKIWPWELRPTGKVVDHINRDPLDNRLANLRIVDCTENSLNSSTSLNKTGIGRENRHNTFKAYIDPPRKPRINIGTFKTYEEAANAIREYKEAMLNAAR